MKGILMERGGKEERCERKRNNEIERDGERGE